MTRSLLGAGSDPSALCCSSALALTCSRTGVCLGAAVCRLRVRRWRTGVADIGRLWGDGRRTPLLIHAAEERRQRGLRVSLEETDR